MLYEIKEKFNNPAENNEFHKQINPQNEPNFTIIKKHLKFIKTIKEVWSMTSK